MKHINALLNSAQETNLQVLLQDALIRADLPEGFPLSVEEIEELEEVLF